MFIDFLKKYRNDLLLIVTILAFSFSSLIIIDFMKTEGATAVVIVNGKEHSRYPLNKDARVMIENGESHNLLVIEDGVATIKAASCPDKRCVKQNGISHNGETLVCLPNKTTVKIVSEIEPETDFIS